MAIKLSTEFEVRTVRELNWLGTTNGALLRKAASNNFDVMITADRNMYFQQNLRDVPIAVLVVPTNRTSMLKQIVPAIEDSLRVIRANQFTTMDFGKTRTIGLPPGSIRL